jgi:uncharacterized protein (TIGR03000 family)
MYSVVVLMALSGGEAQPAHGLRGGGCQGGCYGGCYGGGYGGGCYGGGCYGGGGGLFGGRRHGCHGGGGGCYGGGYGGCYGGGYGGCYGGGCYGGGYGGCCGGGYGGCYGGGMMVYGGGCCGGGMIIGPGGGIRREEEKKKEEVSSQATLVVNLPADATLLIDGDATTATTGRRVFVAGPMPEGREFRYTVRAEAMRQGKMVSTEQEVVVKAGDRREVTLELPAPTVASAR